MTMGSSDFSTKLNSHHLEQETAARFGFRLENCFCNYYCIFKYFITKMSVLLELWVFLKLVATVFVLPFYGLMVMAILAFTYRDYVEQFFFLAVFIIMVADAIFDIFLMLASYKKSISMFKLYFVYGIIYAISVPTIFISWVLYSKYVLGMDLCTPQAKNNIIKTSAIIIGVLTVHLFALFLIKLEINKLKIGCEFTKETSASSNSLLPSKDKKFKEELTKKILVESQSHV